MRFLQEGFFNKLKIHQQLYKNIQINEVCFVQKITKTYCL